MGYPFCLSLELQSERRKKSLFEMACTKGYGTGFCTEFCNDRAWNFDSVKECVSKIRGDMLCSADAYIECSNGERVFIEFKQRGGSHLEHEKDISNLRKKMLDSLTVAVLSFQGNTPMDTLRHHAHFLIVYADDDTAIPKNRIPNANKITQAVRHAAKRPKDAWGCEIRWNLNRFETADYYRSVHTWTESEFSRFGRSMLAGNFPEEQR